MNALSNSLSTLQRRLLAAIAAIAALAAAVALGATLSGDSNDVALDVDTDAPSTTALPLTDDVSATTSDPSTTRPPSTPPSTTQPSTTPPSTTVPATMSSTTLLTSDPDLSGLDGDLLFESSNGTRLIRYAAPTELDCDTGIVVAELDGVVTKVYERAASAGFIRAFPGPFDSTALIGTCEETVDFVAFLESVGPDSGAQPPVVSYVDLSDELLNLTELGWRGSTGYFGADADLFDGDGTWVEAVVFSPESLTMQRTADIGGTRLEYPSSGFDLIVPDTWTVFEQLDDVSIQSSESDAYVRVTLTEIELPLWGIVQLDDEVVVDQATVSHQLFVGDSGRAQRDRKVDADEIHFSSPDGLRIVRQVVFDGVTVTIESFTPAGEGLAYQDVPALTAESVRVFSSFG